MAAKAAYCSGSSIRHHVFIHARSPAAGQIRLVSCRAETLTLQTLMTLTILMTHRLTHDIAHRFSSSDRLIERTKLMARTNHSPSILILLSRLMLELTERTARPADNTMGHAGKINERTRTTHLDLDGTAGRHGTAPARAVW